LKNDKINEIDLGKEILWETYFENLNENVILNISILQFSDNGNVVNCSNNEFLYSGKLVNKIEKVIIKINKK
jgi:hypothetical protein